MTLNDNDNVATFRFSLNTLSKKQNNKTDL